MIDINYLEHLATVARHVNEGAQVVQLGGVDFDMEEFLQKLNEMRELFSDGQGRSSEPNA